MINYGRKRYLSESDAYRQECGAPRKRLETVIADQRKCINEHIINGLFEEVDNTLKQMHPLSRSQILQQTFTEFFITPLLLLPYSRAQTLSLSTIKKLGGPPSNPNATDVDGNTLLHLLVRRDREKDLERLLERTDDPEFPWLRALLDCTNDEGRTALHVAVMQGHSHAIDALLKAGADVNFKSLKTHLTPLHFAVLEGKTSVVEQLLQYDDIDVNAVTLGNESVLAMAQRSPNNKEIVSMLMKRGAVFISQPADECESDSDESDEEQMRTAFGRSKICNRNKGV